LNQEASAAIEFFVRERLSSLATLQRIRPPRVPGEIREAVLRSLPAEGELNPTPKERGKLGRIRAVLALHDRADAIEVKLIDVFQAAVGLHARTVTLISRKALNLLTAEEVQALAAHEIGHDYFWDEYEQAAAREQWQVVRELELRCDAVALLTLRALGLDSRSLASAIRKLSVYNSRLGTPNNEVRYVSEAERIRFQRAFVAHLQSEAATAKRR